MNTDDVLQDIDTPEDYQEYLKRKGPGKVFMTLEEAFSLKKREVISLVGGGGKTSLFFALGKELSSRGKGIILTTTTKIWEPAASPHFTLFFPSIFRD